MEHLIHLVHMLEGTPPNKHTYCSDCLVQTGEIPNVFKLYTQRFVYTVIIAAFLIGIFSWVNKHEESKIKDKD